jgi:hypothetical protein
MNLIIVGIILTVAMFRLILELLNYRNRNQHLLSENLLQCH